MVVASNLSFAYRTTAGESVSVLNEVSLKIKQGSYASIIGPSGCGKSTLLFCLSGLLDTEAGIVSLGDFSPNEARSRHKIGFVFQKPVFFEWMTTLENVLLPARVSGLNHTFFSALSFFERFSLSKFANRYPHELSGGMLSRAALVRALIHEPEYLFLDEAFNYLDEALREDINMDIQKIWLDKKMTVVSVTHSIEEAVFMSDYVFVMSRRPSSIIHSYKIAFDRPRNPLIRRDSYFIEMVDEIREALKQAHKHMGDHQSIAKEKSKYIVETEQI